MPTPRRSVRFVTAVLVYLSSAGLSAQLVPKVLSPSQSVTAPLADAICPLPLLSSATKIDTTVRHPASLDRPICEPASRGPVVRAVAAAARAGNLVSSQIVWGTSCVGTSTDGEHIVRSTADRASSTVWDNLAESDEIGAF